jgi:hypothetical protein
MAKPLRLPVWWRRFMRFARISKKSQILAAGRSGGSLYFKLHFPGLSGGSIVNDKRRYQSLSPCQHQAFRL